MINDSLAAVVPTGVGPGPGRQPDGILQRAQTRRSRHEPPGSIIQISSMMGHTGLAFPAYTATKGAILSLTRQLAGELGPAGIRVNSVSPGMILTAMTQDAMADPTHREHTTTRTPLRALGTPADIAYAVLHLAGDLSTFVTGTDILVDGGLVSTLAM